MKYETERTARLEREEQRGINTCTKAGTVRAAHEVGQAGPIRHEAMTNLAVRRPPSPCYKYSVRSTYERVAAPATDPSPRLDAGRGAAALALLALTRPPIFPARGPPVGHWPMSGVLNASAHGACRRRHHSPHPDAYPPIRAGATQRLHSATSQGVCAQY